MRARLLFLAFLVVFFTANVAFQIFGRVYAAEFHVTNATGLQNALTTAQNNGQDDTIYLAAGVYSAVENGKSFVYDSTNGDNRKLTICGENGTTPDQVILDGNNAFAPVLSLVDENPDHLNSAFTVQGITIRNGKMQEWDQNGGGLYIDLEFKEEILECWVIVKDCIIRNNVGDDAGGVAIYTDGCSVRFVNNVVIENTAMDDNGGAEIWGSPKIICSNNIIASNTATDTVGGMEIGGGELIFVNNTISMNTAINNDFCQGGGIDIDTDKAYLYNNIIWGNKSAGDLSDIGDLENVEAYDYCNDYHSVIGSQHFLVSVGHIDADPLFVNPAAHDYHLSANSPCIDAGTADAPELPAADFEGDPRIVGSAPDIGADEYYTGQLVPIPDIKVNGSDGPITLYQNDTLTITVSLNNNGITDNADWWLAAQAPFGLYFYTFSGWVPYTKPAYQHPLFYLPTYEVFSTSISWLQEGTYTFYFGVDMVMDGIITWDSLYYDTVEVNITE